MRCLLRVGLSHVAANGFSFVSIPGAWLLESQRSLCCRRSVVVGFAADINLLVAPRARGQIPSFPRGRVVFNWAFSFRVFALFEYV